MTQGVPNRKPTALLAVTLFVLLGIVLRVMVSRGYYLSADETWHIDISSRPLLDAIAYNFSGNLHPPLYFVWLHLLLAISHNVETLRMLSLLPWIIWVYVCFRIGRRLEGERSGLIWAGIATFTAVSVDLSLDLRGYMWMLLFITVQFYYFLGLYERVENTSLVKYALCGLLAIGFDYGAVPPILVMGSCLAWRACRPVISYRPGIKIAMAHLLLAIAFAALYLQQGIAHEKDVQWYGANYYHGYYSILLSLVRLSGLAVPVEDVTSLIVSVAIMAYVLIYVRSSLRRLHTPAAAWFFYGSLVCVCALTFGKLYPPPVAPRFLCWMLPGIFAALAVCTEHLYVKTKSSWHMALSTLLVAVPCGYILAGFHLPETPTVQEFTSFRQAADAIGGQDVAITDIQTMLALKATGDWPVTSAWPHFREARWRDHRILYPNWPFMNLIVTVTEAQAGGIALSLPTLQYAVGQLQQEKQPPHFIWLLSIGLPVNLSMECEVSMYKTGDMTWKAEHSFVIRFTPRQFADFVSHCPAKSLPF